MKALLLAFLVACSSWSDVASGGDDATSPDADASAPPATAYKLDLGENYESASPVTISAAKKNGVYNGYFQASSDLGSVPNIVVTMNVADARLTAGMSLGCARSRDAANVGNETGVLVHWLDGDTYYTNVMATQNCTIHITAASQTRVSADISGTIYDQMDPALAPTTFAASFTANVRE